MTDSDTPRCEGVVKFFDDTKGWGFIGRDGEPDLFVHYSGIAGNGRRSLEDGQRVSFIVGKGRKGAEAREVEVLPA